MTEIIKEELPHKLDVTYSPQLSGEVKIVIKANSKERNELATRFDLDSIKTLMAFLSVTNTKPGFFCVTGTIDADLTLLDSEINEMVDFTLNDRFEELFAFPEALDSGDEKHLKNQFDFELIENNTLPLGEVVAQNFSLALEYLFLNLPGSTTQNIIFSDESNEKNIVDGPFAVLKALDEKSKN
ncbi:hypothetical protein OAI47_04140 [Rhodospirillaceae bacterium]|nr:hypothetical protein [Rhodospirillaceae bacterium]